MSNICISIYPSRVGEIERCPGLIGDWVAATDPAVLVVGEVSVLGDCGLDLGGWEVGGDLYTVVAHVVREGEALLG